jgi:hypothetical protein
MVFVTVVGIVITRSGYENPRYVTDKQSLEMRNFRLYEAF